MDIMELKNIVEQLNIKGINSIDTVEKNLLHISILRLDNKEAKSKYRP